MTPTSQRKPASERRVGDFYPTPPDLAVSALKCIEAPHPRDLQRTWVLDAGCGTGVWGRAARQVWPGRLALHGIDMNIQPDHSVYGLGLKRDFISWSMLPYTQGRYDYVIGNPPYGDAEAWVWAAHRVLKPRGVLAFLLRLNFLGGQARGEGLWQWWSPTSVHVSSKRPDFTGGGGDMTEYALFVWRKGHILPARTTTTVHWFTFEDGSAEVAPLLTATIQQPALFEVCA